MGTFILKQTRTSMDLLLIPSADGCNIDLIPVGDTNNWECVDDPIAIPDDDDTYVISSATNLKYDLYILPNHTTESGTINYIQVFSRAKTHENPQHEDGIYKIIITDDACSNIYKSNDINLIVSTYKLYDNVWTENPRTAAAWTWDDIDNLQIGLECSSPTVIGAGFYRIYRPEANGDLIELDNIGDAPNYKCVNDSSESDYVRNETDGNDKDIYVLPNHVPATEFGVIDNVVICRKCKRYVVCSDSNYFEKYALKTHGVLYNGTEHNLTTSWVLYSDTLFINPNTSNAWTWAEIDALQIGTWLWETCASGLAYDARCCEVYAVINYTQNWNPEIRTTQCYAMINYTPPDIECTLDKPEEISIDHDQNIKMLNFWSGNRAVYGLSRNGRTMVMTGILYSNTACTTIQCIEDLAENGSAIKLSNLGSYNYDKEVRIASFGWKKISDEPLAYRWIMECEFTE